MGLSQAKWRTLLHLSVSPNPLTQAEIAARLGIEEPTLVTLLHRLESAGWVKRRSSSHDRRCKTVELGQRAQRVIVQINAQANQLRREFLSDVPMSDLRICMGVLDRILAKAGRAAEVKGKGGLRNGKIVHPVGANGRSHRAPRKRK
jgi:MarR family transcriptional regulator for hemolysin